jgi:hypothetical protein
VHHIGQSDEREGVTRRVKQDAVGDQVVAQIGIANINSWIAPFAQAYAMR